MVETSEIDCRQLLRHVAEHIAEFIPAFYQSTSLNQQPNLFAQISYEPAVSRPYLRDMASSSKD